MVHHSKARTLSLTNFIMKEVVGHRTAFEISDVKQDGTVFVKFRSYMQWRGIMLAEDFGRALMDQEFKFIQTSDVQFRLALDQFPISV